MSGVLRLRQHWYTLYGRQKRSPGSGFPLYTVYTIFDGSQGIFTLHASTDIHAQWAIFNAYLIIITANYQHDINQRNYFHTVIHSLSSGYWVNTPTSPPRVSRKSLKLSMVNPINSTNTFHATVSIITLSSLEEFSFCEAQRAIGTLSLKMTLYTWIDNMRF